jgi:hypothetical protein
MPALSAEITRLAFPSKPAGDIGLTSNEYFVVDLFKKREEVFLGRNCALFRNPLGSYSVVALDRTSDLFIILYGLIWMSREESNVNPVTKRISFTALIRRIYQFSFISTSATASHWPKASLKDLANSLRLGYSLSGMPSNAKFDARSKYSGHLTVDRYF